MEQWDADLEQRVWRRVRGQSAELPDLEELIRLSSAQAADVKALDRELYRQEQVTLRLLTGLREISGGRQPDTVRPSPGSRQQRLQRCLSRCRELLRLLLALESHERYGPLFTDLTRLQRAKCARLEQLARIRPGSKF